VGKIRKIMDKELGFVDSSSVPDEKDQTTYLFINCKNKVVGCVVVERIEKAYPVIISNHGSPVDNEQTSNEEGDKTTTPSTTNTTTAEGQPELSFGEGIKEQETKTEPKMEWETTMEKEQEKEKKVEMGSANPRTDHGSGKVKEEKKRDKEKTNNQHHSPENRNFSVSCSTEERPAVCGISRIWTLRSERRKGIATRLLDAIRTNMIYGYNIPKNLCAFSQPTADGKLFFEIYTQTRDFLVYL